MADDANYKILAQRISEALYYVWDPIGVNDVPAARDEYDSYVPDLVSAALADKTKEFMSDQLSSLATTRMGLHQNKNQDDKVAEIILAWAKTLKIQ